MSIRFSAFSEAGNVVQGGQVAPQGGQGQAGVFYTFRNIRVQAQNALQTYIQAQIQRHVQALGHLWAQINLQGIIGQLVLNGFQGQLQALIGVLGNLQIQLANSRGVISVGLRGGPLNVLQWQLPQLQVNHPSMVELGRNISELVRRWWLANGEAARRTIIDIFLRKVLARPEHLYSGVYLEEVIGAHPNQPAHSVSSGGQIGHGRLDYLISPALGLPPEFLVPLDLGATLIQPNPPDFREAVVVEAKACVFAQGQLLPEPMEQLAAQLATMWQLAQTQHVGLMQERYFRGILTDGRYWCFCQFDGGPQPQLGQLPPQKSLQWSLPYDATTLVDTLEIMSLIQLFNLYPNRLRLF
jgi:hypothetical protein